jgi:broad specificity phosphatase PhoE
MKLYFIRHAQTTANSTGTMVAGYENSDILSLDKPEDWKEKVGQYIPESDRKYIVSSPTKRCISTAKMLFDKLPNEVTNCLSEFDCKALGGRKFWEITKQEFDKLVFLRAYTIEKRALEILYYMRNVVKHEANVDAVVCISHGMLIRYLYHFMTNHKDISAYDVINSVGFKFANLDLLIIDTVKKTVEVHNYQEPINHK